MRYFVFALLFAVLLAASQTGQTARITLEVTVVCAFGAGIVTWFDTILKAASDIGLGWDAASRDASLDTPPGIGAHADLRDTNVRN